ncbi:hypothetical protein [Chryseobacterium sp.]|uniref:hypothetical protein n=1 Tax=Chryseobacterium sp. TaxID=1871047 RepID=UPI0025BC1FA8|nr:hypothetical protein [Chryseobacterium sp.]MBV8328037.1 hypothetical protein [Chryseobacterium sp.]
MTELIRENKFEELKGELKSQKEFQIYTYLSDILDGKTVHLNEHSFTPEKYQAEFTEGSKLYQALAKSELDREQLAQFIKVVVELAFTMGLHVQEASLAAMSHGVPLTHAEHIYKIDPEIRHRIQELINILKNTPEQEKAVANLSTAKAKVTHAVDNTLQKYEVGEDMLQLAESYEKVAPIEMVVPIYQGILSDFECESVRNSSGLIPETIHVDDRPEAEIAIFNEAKIHFERITGKTLEEPNRIHIKESKDAAGLVQSIIDSAFESSEAETEEEIEVQEQPNRSAEPPVQSVSEKQGLLTKIKRIFGKN